MSSVFTKIVNGEIPSYRIAESENCFAFLDINPLMKGHTIVIPKREIDYIFDLDDQLYDFLFSFAREIAGAIKKSVDCKRVAVAVIGMEVPHAHIHLIPINEEGDIDFKKERVKLTKEQFAEIALKISNNITK